MQPYRNSFTIVVFILFFIISFSAYSEVKEVGDANNDGILNINDVQVTVDHLLGKSTASGDPDYNSDGNVNSADVVSLINYINQPTPTPTTSITPTPSSSPTITPTPTSSPTPSSTPTYDIKDYFILSQGSSWHYSGFEGGSPDDDFQWTVLLAAKDLGDGVSAVQILTNTDESSDARNLDTDYWILEPDGDLFLGGFYKGTAIDHIPVQDIIFNTPIKFGSDNMTIGQSFVGSTTALINATLKDEKGNIERIPATVTINSTVTYTNIIPVRTTPIGTFTNVIRLTWNLSINAGPLGSIPLKNNTFFLKNGKGMVVQDQESDTNDAELQGLDIGSVGGVPIAADIPTSPLKSNVIKSVNVNLGDVSGYQGEDILIPIHLNDISTTPTAACNFDISYNPTLLTPVEVTTASGSSTHISDYNMPDSGHYRGIIYSNPVTQFSDGTIANIKFQINIDANPNMNAIVTVNEFNLANSDGNLVNIHTDAAIIDILEKLPVNKWDKY